MHYKEFCKTDPQLEIATSDEPINALPVKFREIHILSRPSPTHRNDHDARRVPRTSFDQQRLILMIPNPFGQTSRWPQPNDPIISHQTASQ